MHAILRPDQPTQLYPLLYEGMCSDKPIVEEKRREEKRREEKRREEKRREEGEKITGK